MHSNAATWNFITSGKSHARTGGPSKQQRVVLRRRNTVVGGKCALPSALLVDLSRCGCQLSHQVWWTFTNHSMTQNALSLNVKESGKLILDQHRSLIISVWSTFAHAYQVWSTSINAFVSYLADRRTHRHTDRRLITMRRLGAHRYAYLCKQDGHSHTSRQIT